jgi:hypothetical protein
MNLIGKSVSHVFADTFRFGTVTEEKTENSWTYVKVIWTDDEKYEMDKQRVIKLRGYNKYSEWYRIDSVNIIDTTSMINTLKKLEKVEAKLQIRKKILSSHQQRSKKVAFSTKIPAC